LPAENIFFRGCILNAIRFLKETGVVLQNVLLKQYVSTGTVIVPRKLFIKLIHALNGVNLIFLSSLPLSPPAITAVFGTYLSSFNSQVLNEHCISGAGLPIHMNGEVLWEPKRRRAGVLHCI
jgi:hypothetical protein